MREAANVDTRKPRANRGTWITSAVLPLVSAYLALILAAGPGLSMAGEPSFPAIPGWELAGEPVVYTPDNLWDFINGAAESYLAYAFVDLHVGEYVGPESVAVRAELYRHPDPENAFGIYATERAPDYSFIAVGAQGYREEGVLNFLRGKYYVKLSTHQRGPAADAALRTIAGSIDAHLPGGATLPAGLELLPADGRQLNTEGYVAQNFLGYGFLHHAFTARYEKGIQLFVMEYSTADGAAEALRKLLVAAPGTRAGPDRYSISDPNNGPIAVARHGSVLYGAVGAPDAATEKRYLNMLVETLGASMRH